LTSFRVAVVGTGSVSALWLPSLCDRQDVEVVALVDVDVAAARAAGELHGIAAPVFRELEDAVRATAPDVIVNLTPPEWHRPIVEAALGLGCHVLGEKPIATTLEDAYALVRAAEDAGRTYAVMQNRRFEPGIRTLRDGVAAGRIGRTTLVACDFFKAPHFGGFREKMQSPFLLDMAIHHFDQARFVSGADPVAVWCHEFDPAGSWYEGDAAASCTFELGDGSVFSYRGSWCADGFATSWNGSWRVVGTRGTALWDGEGEPVAELARAPAEPVLLHPVERVEWGQTWQGRAGHAGCLDEMLEALAQQRKPETDCADNAKSLAMVLAALASAREARRLELEELVDAVS
jgi:predicted dehydrogenase